jgi:hypothetical protein
LNPSPIVTTFSLTPCVIAIPHNELSRCNEYPIMEVLNFSAVMSSGACNVVFKVILGWVKIIRKLKTDMLDPVLSIFVVVVPPL